MSLIKSYLILNEVENIKKKKTNGHGRRDPSVRFPFIERKEKREREKRKNNRADIPGLITVK